MSGTITTQDLLRHIPKVDRLLASAEIEPLLAAYPRREIVERLRETLDDLRRRAGTGDLDEHELSAAAIGKELDARLARRYRPYYRRVINATGVILHTGLGRAALADEAVRALAELAPHPQRVEVDLETGERGGRELGCARLLCELVGAEAATVVNNNAAATLLILAALARGKRVLLSRGEMVEIGGSYRIPEILRESGALLAEVGTTNRTHLRDYAEALDDQTGMILKVHTSNYRVVGFTSEVEIAELADLGREHGVPVVHDLGSGCLVDLAAHGRPGETLVRDSLHLPASGGTLHSPASGGTEAAGADLVCFSGDKLLGGPQAGLIAGRAEAVEKCRKHPLFRAMRPGRLVYTALEATLRLYLGGEEEAIRTIPALRRLTIPAEDLRPRAEELARRLEDLPGFKVEASECASQAGSGSLPARGLPSWGVRLRPRRSSAGDLAARLRCGDPSILARVQDDALIFDLRTLDEDEADAVEERLRELSD